MSELNDLVMGIVISDKVIIDGVTKVGAVLLVVLPAGRLLLIKVDFLV